MGLRKYITIFDRNDRSDFGEQIGVGRDDGVAAGEFSPIFFDKSIF